MTSDAQMTSNDLGMTFEIWTFMLYISMFNANPTILTLFDLKYDLCYLDMTITIVNIQSCHFHQVSCKSDIISTWTQMTLNITHHFPISNGIPLYQFPWQSDWYSLVNWPYRLIKFLDLSVSLKIYILFPMTLTLP